VRENDQRVRHRALSAIFRMRSMVGARLDRWFPVHDPQRLRYVVGIVVLAVTAISADRSPWRGSA